MQNVKQNVLNLERKGPHKSMHCKFCKPPGVVTPEKPTRPQLETKTKVRLAHEAADLKFTDIHDEPGLPAVESEACICILEGHNSCPKCVPDKNRASVKKKTCRCPKGAKQHPIMFNGTVAEKKKEKEEDDEWWWEKYSREHDALAKETWAAYMAQRKKDKKLEKCQKNEQEVQMMAILGDGPRWYRKLSCQQILYVEFLSTAIRLDSDENITDRTYFVLSGIGLYPRPKRKVLKKCLRFCHYNAIQFLNQLHLLTKNDDPFKEKGTSGKGTFYTWNELLIMNCLCHLEFPLLLREIMDRLPPFPRKEMLPQIPYPVFPKIPKKKYNSPYEEPIWKDTLNWVEKKKIDAINRSRLHMDSKRVKIPPLALVKRPSLIDARPPFLNQIEANERAARRLVKEKEVKVFRKRPKTIFNSATDVTAIANIEASEVSTTMDKTDTDEVCVFLREPVRVLMRAEDEEEFMPEPEPEKEVKFTLEDPPVTTQVRMVKNFDECFICSDEDIPDIPFQTPPKKPSGTTIQSPCPPPDGTPGPPAYHYDIGRRELDILNTEGCKFQTFISCESIVNTLDPEGSSQYDVTQQLQRAAEKLKAIAGPRSKEEIKEKEKEKEKGSENKKCEEKEKDKIKDEEKEKEKPEKENTEQEVKEKRRRKSKDKGRRKSKVEKKELKEKKVSEKKAKKKVKKIKKKRKRKIGKKKMKHRSDKSLPQEESDNHEPSLYEEDFENVEEEEKAIAGFEINDDEIELKLRKKLEKARMARKISIISDEDPDPEAYWASRPPCLKEVSEEQPKKKHKKKKKKQKKKSKKIKKKKRQRKDKPLKKLIKHLERKENSQENKDAMGECHSGQLVQAPSKENEQKPEKREKRGASVFKGDVKPLLQNILIDLAEEGFISATYENIHQHPDIDQLVLHLKGEMITRAKKEYLLSMSKAKWAVLNQPIIRIPVMYISPKKAKKATWNDKKWLTKLAKSKTDEFYFNVASWRANIGAELWSSLFQTRVGTFRYLDIFFAYMVSKYDDAILRGLD